VESLLLLEDAFDLFHTLYSGYLGSPAKQPQIEPTQKGRDQSAKEALAEIRQMHRDWKEKLARETVEGELSDAGG